MAEFYVYLHRRRDSGAAFYVGKGRGDRAHRATSRNPHWRAIVAKHGGPAVELVAHGVTEEFALLAEIELIDVLRRRGVRLANLTDGGEGVSGFTRKQSPEEIARRAAANTGRKRTPEQCARIAAAKAGHGVGSHHSAETKKKMSAKHLGHHRSLDMLRGRRRPEHVIEALRAANDERFAERRTKLIEAIRKWPEATLRELCDASGCGREMAALYKRRISTGDL